jgi:hypothetical protein
MISIMRYDVSLIRYYPVAILRGGHPRGYLLGWRNLIYAASLFLLEFSLSSRTLFINATSKLLSVLHRSNHCDTETLDIPLCCAVFPAIPATPLRA